MWSAVKTLHLPLPGTRILTAAGMIVALQAPAAAFEWTVPASYHALSLRSGDENHDLIGLQMPLFWAGGPIGPLALHFAGGYAFQREQARGDNLNFITLQADLDYELPFPILVPYVGVEAMGWYPLDARGYMQGIPLMAAPHAGVRFSLFDIVAMDFWAFGFPAIPGMANLAKTENIWNLTNSGGNAYTGTSWGAGGRISLNL